MDYSTFQQVVSEAGLSMRQFALMLKLNPNSISNCKPLGVVPSHLGVIALLVRELALNDLDYRAVVAQANLVPNAPRGLKSRAFAKEPNKVRSK